jgi:hypothetical protein
MKYHDKPTGDLTNDEAIALARLQKQQCIAHSMLPIRDIKALDSLVLKGYANFDGIGYTPR